MKPSFDSVARHYPSNKTITQEALFKEIGWDDLIGNPAYHNTCAIRVSLALIKAGMSIGGRIAVKRGPHKGKKIEPGQAKLANMLTNPAYFGVPEKIKRVDAERVIGLRHGVVSFWKIPGYLNGNGGHIDLIGSASGGLRACGSDCYWNSADIWFWELR